MRTARHTPTITLALRFLTPALALTLAACAAPTATPLPPPPTEPPTAIPAPPTPQPEPPTPVIEPTSSAAAPPTASAATKAPAASAAVGAAKTVPTAEPLNDWYALSSRPFPSGPGAEVGKGYPFQLYTHCGIEFDGFSGRWWRAIKPLNDGQGGPPMGWGDPHETGTMTLVKPDEAMFKGENGVEVRFRLSDVEPPPCH
jgi:hypothetical protein